MLGFKKPIVAQPAAWTKIGFDLIGIDAGNIYGGKNVKVRIRRNDTGEIVERPKHVSDLMWQSRGYFERTGKALFSLETAEAA